VVFHFYINSAETNIIITFINTIFDSTMVSYSNRIVPGQFPYFKPEQCKDIVMSGIVNPASLSRADLFVTLSDIGFRAWDGRTSKFAQPSKISSNNPDSLDFYEGTPIMTFHYNSDLSYIEITNALTECDGWHKYDMESRYNQRAAMEMMIALFFEIQNKSILPAVGIM
jgi:hypothetical protein